MPYQRARANWQDYPAGDSPIMAVHLNTIEAGIVNATNLAESDSGKVPVGALMPYAGLATPAGWLLCKGQSLDRGTYPDLFKAIGTLYGAADAQHFSVPDLRTRVPVGVSDNHMTFGQMGSKGGEERHTLRIDEMPSHTHILKGVGISFKGGLEKTNLGSGNGWTTVTNFTGGGMPNLQAAPTGVGNPHNNMPPYIVLNFIIRAS